MTARPLTRVDPSAPHNGRYFHNGDGSRPTFLPHFAKVFVSAFGLQRWGGSAHAARSEPLDLDALLDRADVSWSVVGHATVLMRIDGVTLLTDPVWSRRIGPRPFTIPRRTPPPFPLDALPPIDLVLLTHDHYDHCDIRTLRWLAERDQPRVVTGLGVGALLGRAGLERVEELDWWGSAEVGGLRLHYVPARHFSGRGWTFNKTLWGGFVVEASDRAIYFAGDTAYCPELLEVRARFGPPDLAFLPIGAYRPRRYLAAKHVSPEESVRLHLELGAARSIAIHFGTFQLSQENLGQQVADFDAARAGLGVTPEAFSLPVFGAVEALSGAGVR